MAQEETGFSKLRSFFWPIYRHELIKFLPMLLFFFLIGINYELLKIAKDSLIITAPHSGAEVIPFLKVWAMLPTALFMTFVITKLVNHLNREKLFYVIIISFLAFFAFFALFLFPYREQLFLNSVADRLQEFLPHGFKGMIALIRYWMFALFYVMAESWSNIMLSVLLWGFANEVTSVSEARRFYALFGIGVNSSGIIAGKFGEIFTLKMRGLTTGIHPIVSLIGGKTGWDQTIITFMGIVILCGLLSIGIFRWLHLYIFTDLPKKTKIHEKLKTPKMTFRSTIAYICKSKYLLCIACIVLSYNITINLTEVLWKSQIRELYPNPVDYTAFMSKITYFIGLLATGASYLFTGNMIRRCGWKRTALLTPIIIMITSFGFFSFLFVKQIYQHHSVLPMIFGFSPLALGVFFGSLQNILSRSAKYTVFDDTKEMAFIPLPREIKMKGKSAIDGIGSRLGKSGSSLMLQILFMFFATPIACSPIIFFIIVFLIPVWIRSILSLGKQFHALTTISKKEALDEKRTEKAVEILQSLQPKKEPLVSSSNSSQN